MPNPISLYTHLQLYIYIIFIDRQLDLRIDIRIDRRIDKRIDRGIDRRIDKQNKMIEQKGMNLNHDFYVVVGKLYRKENAQTGHQYNIFI